jgi:hypothetical protein
MKENDKPASLDPKEWPDELPPCLIYVDKEGRLWHYNAEMTHEGINRLLTDHVELDEKGRYVISFRGQRCFVDVEDTLFVITRVDHLPAGNGALETFRITLNDRSEEELDPATLSLSAENVLYTRVKSGRFPARFLRKSYYQLADYIVEKDGAFFLPLRGRDYRLA